MFFPGKKGRNGQYFLFVRFKGVENIYKMEKKLNGINHKGRVLLVNLEKYM